MNHLEKTDFFWELQFRMRIQTKLIILKNNNNNRTTQKMSLKASIFHWGLLWGVSTGYPNWYSSVNFALIKGPFQIYTNTPECSRLELGPRVLRQNEKETKWNTCVDFCALITEIFTGNVVFFDLNFNLFIIFQECKLRKFKYWLFPRQLSKNKRFW